MTIPPGLTCCRCHGPFDRELARRTLAGWRHARPCTPALDGGRWVRRGLTSRWVRA